MITFLMREGSSSIIETIDPPDTLRADGLGGDQSLSRGWDLRGAMRGAHA